MRIKDIVNMALFTLLSPLIGYEEALRVINGEINGKAGRILLMAAKHYEQSGVSYDAYFEFIMQRFSSIVDDWRRMSGELNLSILLITASVIMVEALMLMMIGAGIAESVIVIIPLMLIPIIHANQVELIEYDYIKPSLAGAVAAIGAYAALRSIPITLISLSVGFSILYVPQFLRTINLIMTMDNRLLEPILELTWSPNPREIVGSSIIEREFSRIRDVAYSVGAPYFVAKVSRVVDSLVFHIKSLIRDNVIYGSLMPINYIALLLFVKFINGIASTLPANSTPMPFNFHIPLIYLIISAAVVSVLTGKVIHSIGLGVSIMGLFIALTVFI